MPKLAALALLLATVPHARFALAADVPDVPTPTSPTASSAASIEFSLDFVAPGGCDGRAEFETALLDRSTGARLAPARAGTLALAVVLAEDGAAFSGVLGITLPNGARSERVVRDASCREALLSLAVIASLVLDAYRSGGALPPEKGAETPTNPPTNETQTETPPTPAEPQPTPPTERSVAAPPERAAAPSSEPGRAGRLEFGLFGAALLETAVAESPPIGVVAGVDVALARASGWSPSARVGFLYTLDGSSSSDAGSAELRLIGARLDLCPWRVRALSALSLVPCVELDAGSLRGGGASAPNPSARDMPWLALGAGFRGAWALSELFTIEAFASGRRLARHDRFVLVAPDDPTRSALLYDVPPWSFGFGLGAALHFR